jgi:photosystem II stability/assembly factor-like uncharacterized protein
MKKSLSIILLALLGAFSSEAQWVKQRLPVAPGASFAFNSVNNISAVDNNVVWGTAGKYLFRTIDGGNTWNDVTPVINDPQFIVSQINSVYAQDATTAYVLVEVYLTHYYLNRVYKTTDGGQTWVRQPQAYPNQTTNGLSQACFIHFFDSNNGVTLASRSGSTGYFEIYTTSNGGVNWSLVPASNLPSPNTLNDYAEVGHKFAAVGNTIWVAVKGNRILKSMDMGLNWTISNTGFPGSNAVSAIAFQDPQNGLVSSGPALKRTSDGGNTWATVNYTGPFPGLELEAVPGAGGLYYSAGKPGSSYSMDNGLTWLNFENTVKHHDIEFVNSQFGFSITDSLAHKFAPIPLGLSKTEGLAAFNIYPNPGTGIFFISNPLAQPFTVEVYNTLGAKVMQQKSGKPATTQFDLTNQPKGLYIVKIHSPSQSTNWKVLLQ